MADAVPEAAEPPSPLVERDGPVLTLTINRPRRKNAADAATWRGLRAALREAQEDPEVRVVVITGAGGDFCAGADLGGLGTSPGHPLDSMRLIADVASTLYEFPKPTVARVSGVAVGAGWNLALCCDFVIADTTARFSQIFAGRGLSLDFGGSWLLPRLVGMLQAKRLALLADFVDAAEARELGLVTWVVEPEELDALVARTAQRLASGAPVALAQSKALLQQGSEGTLRQALENESRAQAVNFATEDAGNAVAAFLAKTEPEFTGRWAVKR